MTKNQILLILAVAIIGFLLFYFAKREENQDQKIIETGTKTVGIITKFTTNQSKNATNQSIYYSFEVNGKTINSSKITANNIIVCKDDNSCVGQKFAVYYLSENPEKFHVAVFEEKIN